MTALRVRPGVHYAPIDGGVYFSSARASFVVKGPRGLFPVVDACLPLLEDGADVEELVAAVGTEAARPLIVHLLETFDTRGLLLHLDQLAVPEPGPEERQRFPETLAYLETYCDDPYAQFRRIRKARVLVAGPAEALGPAVRGLVRAGVGEVTVASDEPQRLSTLAARFPHVRLLLHVADRVPTPLYRRFPDAAVIFSTDDFPTDLANHLPARCATIPVRVGKDLAVVGPTVAAGGAQALSAAERFWARAGIWSQLDGGELLVRPSGDLLAGALSAQVALDALIGLNPGRVHLVHGGDLASDSMAPMLSAHAEYDDPVDFAAPSALVPAVSDPLRWHQAASAPWLGLFRLSVPGELPQMPVALTLADGRSRYFQGRAVGFGPDQETASSEAGLEALRQHCRQRAGVGPAGGHQGPAGDDTATAVGAGLDETRGLLDGALRMIARRLLGRQESSELAWLGVDDIQARRLWRTLEDHEGIPLSLVSRQAPGLGWHLVSVHHGRGSTLLASGWGPTLAVGARAALSAALATAQVRRTVDAGYVAVGMEAGYLSHVHDGFVDELACGIDRWAGTNGQRVRGQRLARDPVAGPIGAWCGSVWLDG